MKSRIFHWVVIALWVLMCAMGIVHVVLRSTFSMVAFIVLAVLSLGLVIAAKLCPHCGSYCLPIYPWKKDLGYCRKCGEKIEYDC